MWFVVLPQESLPQLGVRMSVSHRFPSTKLPHFFTPGIVLIPLALRTLIDSEMHFARSPKTPRQFELDGPNNQSIKLAESSRPRGPSTSAAGSSIRTRLTQYHSGNDVGYATSETTCTQPSGGFLRATDCALAVTSVYVAVLHWCLDSDTLDIHVRRRTQGVWTYSVGTHCLSIKGRRPKIRHWLRVDWRQVTGPG